MGSCWAHPLPCPVSHRALEGSLAVCPLFPSSPNPTPHPTTGPWTLRVRVGVIRTPVPGAPAPLTVYLSAWFGSQEIWWPWAQPLVLSEAGPLQWVAGCPQHGCREPWAGVAVRLPGLCLWPPGSERMKDRAGADECFGSEASAERLGPTGFWPARSEPCPRPGLWTSDPPL